MLPESNMKKTSIILLFSALFSAACFVAGERQSATENVKKDEKAGVQTKSDEKNPANKKTEEEKKDKVKKNDDAKAECLKTKVENKKIDEKQTFVFDFAPFNGSCFVTAHDAEFDNPPLNSEFAIYKDGKEVFKFPNQFNGVNTGCWLEAVAFDDLNEDDLTDIIVIGKCSAKTGPYHENMVYVNKGDRFTTSEEANYTLEKFNKIKDISDFVKKNKEQFFQ
jgi:uncharacterized protein YfkK (UPF0435 family)